MNTRRRPSTGAAREGADVEEPTRQLQWSAPDRQSIDPDHYLEVTGEWIGETGDHWFFVELNAEAEKLAEERFRREFGERLKKLGGEHSRRDRAAYMGRHQNTIAKFERGEVMPNAWELLRLSRLFGCALPDLYGAGGESLREADAKATEFAMIPQYGVRASAGNGRLVEGEEIIGRFAFKRAWLATKGIKVENLAVISADGDSMEPTVRDADILLVDTSVHAIRADGIYLIEQAGELRCKRLQAMVDGGVKIRSDNPRYETEVVSPENAERLRVVAKVIWIGGER